MKKRRHLQQVKFCTKCGLLREPDEYPWLDGLCPVCRDVKRRARRKESAAKVLAQAQETTVERDGRTYVVKVLPAQHRFARAQLRRGRA